MINEVLPKRQSLIAFRVAITMLATAWSPLAMADTIREEVQRDADPVLTRPPALERFAEADYPEDARRRGLEGTVTLEITVSIEGKATDIKVISAPDPLFARAAKEALRRFVFRPAEVDDKPAPVRIRYVYHFNLDAVFRPRLPDWMNGAGEGENSTDALVGSVREIGGRRRLSGVSISIAALGIEVTSDRRGRFRIPKLPLGPLTVRAMTPAHKASEITLTIEEGTQGKIDFYLEAKAIDPYRTVVRGKRRQTTVARVTLRRRALKSVPGTFGDPIRVVQNLPGLARPPYVGGALIIRGAAPGDSGAYLDGIRLPILFHFFGGPSVLNSEFIDRIDYYPGNADVRYSRLLAGVVDVASRKAEKKQVRGSLDINLLNAGAFLSVPIGSKVTVSGAYRRSYIDAILPSILELSDNSATSVVPVYSDYQARIDIRLRGDDSLSVLGFGSDDALDIATNDPEDDLGITLGTRIRFHRVVATWTAEFAGGRGKSVLAPFFGFQKVAFDLGQAFVDLRTWAAGMRDDISFRWSKNVRQRAGVDIRLNHSTFVADLPVPTPYRNPGAGSLNPSGGPGANSGNNGSSGSDTNSVERVDVSQVLGSVGLYSDISWDLTSKVRFVPGVRFDLFFHNKNHYRPSVDPRMMLRYTVSPKAELRAAVGFYSQAPQPNQTNAIVGNPNLVLQHALHSSIGFKRELFVPALSLDVQLYYNYRYNNVIPTDEVVVSADGVRPRRVANAGEGFSTGMEVLLKHEVTRHFYGWIAYTLSWSQQEQFAGEDFQRSFFDQRHILTALGSYRLGRGWEIGFRMRLVSGRPVTPALGGVLDSDSGLYRRLDGQRGSRSTALFNQLDLRIEKTWLYNLWRLAIYVDVQNVYNAENPEAILYDYRFRESGSLRGLPILPTFGIRGSF